MVSKVFNWKARPNYIKGFTGQEKKVKFSKVNEEEKRRLQEILDKKRKGEDNSVLINYIANTPHPENNHFANPIRNSTYSNEEYQTR